MTDNEIIKSMQCVIGNEMLCSECTYQKVLPFPSCRMMCAKNALGLINRQKAEIERLTETLDGETTENMRLKHEIEKLGNDFVNVTKIAKSEAIKEFAERLKTYAKELQIGDNISWLILGVGRVDQLVEEMTEANK